MLFYLKKPKNYVTGQPKPIYMRITVAGLPAELSAGRECLPSRWCPKANRASGNKEDVRTLNSYLDTLDRDIEKAHTDLTKEGAVITAKAIKNKYLVSRKGHITSWRYLQTTIKKWKRYLAKDLSRILLKAIEHQPFT